MSDATSAGLQRSLSLRDVVALGINGVVGQGIFLLPGAAAAMLGPASLLAIVAAGVLCILIALCFAEVGSRYQATGGAYVYAREVFGDFIGFEVGWMTCCVAVIAWAALANGLTEVLAQLVPALAGDVIQPAVAVGVITGLTAINVLGARSGARVVMLFTVAKLIPLALFIVVGFTAIESAHFAPFAPRGYGDIAETILLVLYAYVGFETLVVPAGEMANPKRAVPLALMWVMGIVMAIYCAVFVVAIGTFPALAGHPNPVAAASELFMGPVGGTIVAVGIVLSVFGTNSGSALVSPRRFFALAERGDLPQKLAWVHPSTGAPIPAILLTWALASGLTLTGSFKELAVLSVVARFVQYLPTCLAVIVLRRREGTGGEGFRLPLGPTIPILTLGLCTWLLVNTDPTRLAKGGIALLVGVPLYFLSRWSRSRSST
ncbi:MAG: APC family permease [Myxococcota bacterium]|jgi:amino acid transporter|nr:APC family permease [Myxococcota bacterium]